MAVAKVLYVAAWQAVSSLPVCAAHSPRTHLAGDKQCWAQRHRLPGRPLRSQQATGSPAERLVGGRELDFCKTATERTVCVLQCSGAQTPGLTASVLARGRRAGEQRGPCVLVVRDRGSAVFGCFTAEAWRVAPRYYGTGESFVFQLQVLRQGFLCCPVRVLLCAKTCSATCLQAAGV